MGVELASFSTSTSEQTAKPDTVSVLSELL